MLLPGNGLMVARVRTRGCSTFLAYLKCDLNLHIYTRSYSNREPTHRFLNGTLLVDLYHGTPQFPNRKYNYSTVQYRGRISSFANQFSYLQMHFLYRTVHIQTVCMNLVSNFSCFSLEGVSRYSNVDSSWVFGLHRQIQAELRPAISFYIFQRLLPSVTICLY